MAGSPNPATGVGWDTAIPDSGQPHGNDYLEHRETKLAVAIRNDKEHVAFGASSAGGEHKPGSARIYRGDYSTASAGDNLPTKKPDGATALDANDAGMLAHDTDATYGPAYYEWNGTGWDAIDLLITNIASSVKDEDDMASKSASHVPTQQSTKKYVDDQCDAHIGTAGQYHASGATVFNTTLTAASTFQDLDLSAIVGANSALCFFEVTTPSSAASVIAFKPKGYGGSFSVQQGSYSCSNVILATNAYGYAICATDANGVVQIGAPNNGSTYTVKLVGYVK